MIGLPLAIALNRSFKGKRIVQALILIPFIIPIALSSLARKWMFDSLYSVLRFWEKPSRDVASMLYAKGCLWNTFVLVAAARTLIAAGKQCVPALNERLHQLSAFFGSEQESWAISQCYVLAPRANFSRSVLQRCPGALAVSKLPDVTWCDLGSPARVVKTLTGLGLSPAWLAALPHPA